MNRWKGTLGSKIGRWGDVAGNKTSRWGDVWGNKMGRGTGTLAKHISQAEGSGTCTWP